MIRFLKREEINTQKWDECILESNLPQVFGCSFYLDVCCPNWSALVLGDYEAVFPLIIKEKFFVKHITQPYFIRHFGVYSKNEMPDLNEWLKELSKLAKYININLFNKVDLKTPSYKISEKKYQTLNLNSNYETLKRNYSVSHLRKLKKITTIETKTIDISDYSIFIKEFKSTISEKNLNYSDTHLNTLLSLMKVAPDFCKVISKGLMVNNELVAGLYFIKYGNRLLYLKGFRKLNSQIDGGMFLLFDNIIKENCEKEIILDFGGSNDTNVRQFFNGFGAEDSVYLQLEKNELPPLIRWIKK